jgi:phosphonate transport system substrate-binding protein
VALTLAIVRSEDPASAKVKLEALRAALARELATEVASEHHLRYETLVEAMEAGSVSMAWMPPLLALSLEDRGVARPLVLPVRQGSTSFRAAFFVPLGAKRPLRELRGARVAWVDPSSAAGYRVPRAMVEAEGYDPRSFFASETFYESHDRVVAAVLGELADVGATYCRVDDDGKVVWSGWTESDGTASARVEASVISGPIPNDAFVVSASLEDAVRERLLAVLTSDSPASLAARRLFNAAELVAAERSHYTALRVLTRPLRLVSREGERPSR